MKEEILNALREHAGNHNKAGWRVNSLLIRDKITNHDQSLNQAFDNTVNLLAQEGLIHIDDNYIIFSHSI